MLKEKLTTTIYLFLFQLVIMEAQPIYEQGFGLGIEPFTTSYNSDIAVDIYGNIYSINTIKESGVFPFSDIYLAKYDANQNKIWGFSIQGSPNDRANSITVDDSGNVYIAGNIGVPGVVDFDPDSLTTYNLSSNGGLDFFVAKYNKNGKFVWAFNIGGSGSDDATSIVLDIKKGNILVTGFFQGIVDFDPGSDTAILNKNPSHKGIFIVKYDLMGNYIFGKNLTSNSSALANNLVIDSTDNIYISGFFKNNLDFDPDTSQTHSLTSNTVKKDIFIAKYDSLGDFLWAKQIGSTEDDEAFSMGLDESSNIYITGSFKGVVDFDPNAGIANLSSGSSGGISLNTFFLAKYDANGSYVWATNLEGKIFSPSKLCIDQLNKVYLIGTFKDTLLFRSSQNSDSTKIFANGTKKDVFISIYDSIGNNIYAFNIGGKNDDAASTIYANQNNIYVSGYFSDTVNFNPNQEGEPLISTAGLNDIFITEYYYCIRPDQASISANQFNICEGDTSEILIYIDSGSFNDADNWYWYSNNELLISIGDTLKVSPDENTVYYCKGEGGCLLLPGETSDSVIIVINSLPYLSIGNDTNLCDTTGLFLLDAGSNFNNYKWNTGEEERVKVLNTEIMDTGSYQYWVAIIDQNGCKGNDTIQINLYSCNNTDSIIDNIAEKILSNNIKVYPNPSYGLFYLNSKYNFNMPVLLNISDLYGNRIERQVIHLENSTSVTCKNCVSGIYWIEIRTLEGQLITISKLDIVNM